MSNELNTTASGDLQYDGYPCPPYHMVNYIPFTPYWFPEFAPYFPPNDTLLCWDYASCFFGSASEVTKQQFAATALVMGFIPPTLAEFPWGRRTHCFIHERLPLWLDIIVRALGVVPKVKGGGMQNSTFGKHFPKSRGKNWLGVFICLGGVLAAYAGLALTEIWSKRSALGCVYPVTVLTWWVLVFPAPVEALIVRRAEKRAEEAIKMSESSPESASYVPEKAAAHTTDVDPASTPDQETNGSQQNPVPLSVRARQAKLAEADDEDEETTIAKATINFLWAAYGIAGTLIYTSIMAVYVEELVTWVLLSVAVALLSKLLGFYLCTLYEDMRGYSPLRNPSESNEVS